MVGVINRDHTDYIKDVKDQQSIARLEMDVLSDEGIVLIAAINIVLTACQICELRIYGLPSSIPL
jgi:hypothetical protein